MKKPNIIFILSDQQRHDTCGCYGQELDVTPNLDKMAENVFLHPAEISPHLGGLHLQAADAPEITHGWELVVRMHVEVGEYEFLFCIFSDFRIEIGDLDQVIFFEDFPADTELIGIEPKSSDPASFAVSPVVHLDQGLHDVFAGYLFLTGEAYDSTAPFHGCYAGRYSGRRYGMTHMEIVQCVGRSWSATSATLA